MLEDIAEALDEARAQIAVARQALQSAAPDEPEIRRVVARLERIEAEVARVECRIAERSNAAV